MPSPKSTNPDRYALPPRMFLYTLDQIAMILQVEVKQVKLLYIYYEGRSTGIRPKDRMTARNIAPAGESDEWRIAEQELLRWFRVKGFRYYERGLVDR